MSEYDELLRELDGAGFELESRAAATIRRLREERDAARHNSFTESADRDRLAERVRELEQELDAARKTPVKALEAENEALWGILRELGSDGTMEERAKLRTDREALRYGDTHDPACAIHWASACDCGLDAARERWARKP